MRSLAPNWNRLLGAGLSLVLLMLWPQGWAAGAPTDVFAPAAGEAERGRAIFNGIGGCFNCHGYDGVIARRPTYSPAITEELARLTPPPADLRNPSGLKSRSDQDRFLTIKRGHPGTAMFPKPFLSEREIADLLAYLKRLSEEGPPTASQPHHPKESLR